MPGKRVWPKDNRTASFQEITDPILKAIRFAYLLKRKNRSLDIPYDGLPIGRPEAATCQEIEDALKSENLRYSEEDQGRVCPRGNFGLCDAPRHRARAPHRTRGKQLERDTREV